MSCGDSKQVENSNNKKVKYQNKQDVTAKIIKVENGWGYDIYLNNKRYIHQYLIPGVSGMHAFSTQEKALITANFVIEKIKKGIIPPFVTVKELDSLKVLPKNIKIK